MKKYNASGNVADFFTVYGYSAAQTMVAVLKQCGNNLTRENLMKQAASIQDLKLPMLLPAARHHCLDQRRRFRGNQFAAIKQMQLEKFDGTRHLILPICCVAASVSKSLLLFHCR